MTALAKTSVPAAVATPAYTGTIEVFEGAAVPTTGVEVCDAVTLLLAGLSVESESPGRLPTVEVDGEVGRVDGEAGGAAGGGIGFPTDPSFPDVTWKESTRMR